MAISHPPEIPGYEIRHSVVTRFTTNAAFAGTITFRNLLDTWLVATTATTGADLFFAVKIRKVEIWALPILGVATNVGVAFSGVTAGAVGDLKYHTDTSMGVQPAHVSARPSAKALASTFQLSSAAIAMDLQLPSGAVIDMHLSFIGTFANPVNAQNALVGAGAGATYVRGLDGLAIATTKFTPVVPEGAI